ncbi:MAG: energy-coupling factor ABC transporter ATP-binding protein [Candidatus Heimdallarchaeota archaeon]|nr:energy-coupling factor ABC transporter ATP-binding protein [Candidatus Heimdallarchaeota archaeon]
MNYITVDRVVFSYRRNKALFDGLSVAFSLGEQVAIIGRNGSGKTTLVKLIAGMLRPQRGRILINNETITRKSIAEIATQVGFVFQNPNFMLFTNSVEKELALSLQRFKLSKQEVKERIDETLAFFDLTNYRLTNPRTLSRGEKQKVALATVLIQDPKAIILDEPFSGIDMSQKLMILQYMQKLKQQDKLIILITHSLDLLPTACTRIVALQNGQIAYDLPLKEFFADLAHLLKIGLEPTDYLSFIAFLRKKGLQKDAIEKEEIIAFLLEHALK